MDNPQYLLKQATIEEDDEKRLKKIVKACKLISESLPFEEIIEMTVRKNKELVKNLFLNFVFSPNSIRLILASLLEKFQCDIQFMKQFWEALEYCARLKESTNVLERQNSNFLLDSSTVVGLGMQEGKEQFKKGISVSLFNKGIQNNVMAIKYFSLEFIFDVITILVTQHSVKNLDDRNTIFFLYLHYTSNETFILQTVELIERIKKTFLFYFDNLIHFDNLIEQVFLKKSNVFIQSGECDTLKEDEVIDSFSTYKGGDDKSYAEKVNPVDVLKILFLEKSQKDNQNTDTVLHQDSNQSIVSESDQESEQLEQTTQQQIERWLSSKSPLSIGKSEYMMNFFKQEINVKLFLTFIFFPEDSMPQSFWTAQYPSLKKPNKNAKDIKYYKINSHKKVVQFADERFNCQNMRSYKIVELFKSRHNTKILINLFPTYINLFMYDYFLDEESTGNLNHVAKILEYMIEYDQNQALLNIFSYNIMFNLLEHIYNPYIFEIIVGISDIVSNRYKFTSDNILLIVEYMNQSTWFQELCSLMLSYDHFEKYKKEKAFKMKATHALQRTLLKKIQENEKLKQQVTKKQGNNESLMLNDDSALQVIFIDSKKNIDALNSVFNCKKECSTSSSSTQNDDDFEYLYFQELTGSLPNIDKINLEEIKVFKKQKDSNKRLTERDPSDKKEFKLDVFSPKQAQNCRLVGNTPEDIKKEQLRKRTTEIMQQTLNSSAESITNQFSERALFKIKRVKSKLTLLSLTNKAILEARRFKQLNDQLERRRSLLNKVYDPLQNSTDDVTELNHSLFSTQNGFHSCRLIKPYPNHIFSQMNSDIEQIAKSKEFYSERIIAKEFYSFPCSQVCLMIVRNIFSFQEQHDMLTLYRNQLSKMKEEQVDIIKINQLMIDMLLDENALNFERIFMNYLIKMRVLTKLQDITNSAFKSGRIINIILSNLHIYHDSFDNVYKKIQQMCSDYFDFCCKTIKYLDTNKSDPFILQNLKIKSPIGQSKVILINTVSLVIQVIQRQDILISLTDSIWHTILLWFLNSPTSSVFGKNVVMLLHNTFMYGSKKHIMIILFKLSLITCLYNAYEDLTHSNKPIKSYHIDTFITWVKNIIVSLRMAISDRKFFDVLSSLQTLTSWQNLIKIIPNNVIENIQQKDSYMLSKQNSQMVIDHKGNKRTSLKSQHSFESQASSSHSIKFKQPSSSNHQTHQFSSFLIQANQKAKAQESVQSIKEGLSPKNIFKRQESIMTFDNSKNQNILSKVILNSKEISPILTSVQSQQKTMFKGSSVKRIIK